jgi:C4-dicarboxylate-specific signal transduction histidine kinase
VVLRDAQGEVLKFVGTTTDIDDQERTEEALRQAQADLTRINRVIIVGELTASLPHEPTQPITGTITNANVCPRKIGHEKPHFDEVRAVVTRIVRDAQCAAEVIGRIRPQSQRGAVNTAPAQGFALIDQSLSLIVGACGRGYPWARRNFSPQPARHSERYAESDQQAMLRSRMNRTYKAVRCIWM